MSIETWGLMSKSQIDNETIEQAIIRLVAIHEHDPTAHMGENEAIEAHRKSEIIDHLASSIVPDKFSQVQNLFYNTFQSVLDWIKFGVITNAFLKLKIQHNGNVAGNKYIYCSTIKFDTDENDDTVLDNMFQTEFIYYQNYNVAKYSFGMGIADAYIPPLVCAYFKIENGVLYSVFGDDSIYQTTNLTNLIYGNRYNLRVETVAQTQTCNFYLNSVLVVSYNTSAISCFYIPCYGIFSQKIGGTLSTQVSWIQFKYLAIGNSTY